MSRFRGTGYDRRPTMMRRSLTSSWRLQTSTVRKPTCMCREISRPTHPLTCQLSRAACQAASVGLSTVLVSLVLHEKEVALRGCTWQDSDSIQEPSAASSDSTSTYRCGSSADHSCGRLPAKSCEICMSRDAECQLEGGKSCLQRASSWVQMTHTGRRMDPSLPSRCRRARPPPSGACLCCPRQSTRPT